MTTNNGLQRDGAGGRYGPQALEMMALIKQGTQWNRDEIAEHFDMTRRAAQELGCNACRFLQDAGIDAGSVLYKGEELRRYQTLSTAEEHDNAMGACHKRGKSHIKRVGKYISSSESLSPEEQARAMRLTQERIIQTQALIGGLQEHLLILLGGEPGQHLELEEGLDARS